METRYNIHHLHMIFPIAVLLLVGIYERPAISDSKVPTLEYKLPPQGITSELRTLFRILDHDLAEQEDRPIFLAQGNYDGKKWSYEALILEQENDIPVLIELNLYYRPSSTGEKTKFASLRNLKGIETGYKAGTVSPIGKTMGLQGNWLRLSLTTDSGKTLSLNLFPKKTSNPPSVSFELEEEFSGGGLSYPLQLAAGKGIWLPVKVLPSCAGAVSLTGTKEPIRPVLQLRNVFEYPR